MPETLASHLGLGHFDAAAVTDHSAVADPLVFATVAVPVFHRAKNTLAKQAIAFGLERAIIDGLGLGNFAVGPGADGLGGSELDADGIEVRGLPGGIVFYHVNPL